MIDESKLVKKTGSYAIAHGGAVTDRVLMEVAMQYQNALYQKFLGIGPQDIQKRLGGEEKVLETTKYDGEGVFICYEPERSSHRLFLFNAPSGRVRVGLPAMDHLADRLAAQGIKRGLFRGELYLAGKNGDMRQGISDVLRVSYSSSPTEIQGLKLALYDILMLDGKDLRQPTDFEVIWKRLHDLCGVDLAAPSHCAEGSLVAEKDVETIFQTKVAAGQEGVVVRRLSRLELFKIKPQLSVDAAVIGYVEGEFEGHYGVMSLLTALSYEAEGTPTHWQVIARVGSGFTDSLRQELLQILSPLKVKAPLVMTDSDGRAIHFVKPSLMVEISGHDLMSTSRSEKDTTSQFLTWEKGEWHFKGLTPCPRIAFPVLSRLRSDKDITAGGARLAQILAQPSIPLLSAPQNVRTNAILRREVWTKELKGETMVRKLVVLHQTGEPEAFPYTVTWTDFSPKRKDPLKVEAAYAQTEARAEQLAAQFVADGVAKGWSKVG